MANPRLKLRTALIAANLAHFFFVVHVADHALARVAKRAVELSVQLCRSLFWRRLAALTLAHGQAQALIYLLC